MEDIFLFLSILSVYVYDDVVCLGIRNDNSETQKKNPTKKRVAVSDDDRNGGFTSGGSNVRAMPMRAYG